MAATRPRYCGALLVAAMWLMVVCPGRLAAQDERRKPPPPPFASLFPLEEAWMITLPAVPSAPAAHDGSRVYVPLASAQLVALDWRNGETLWSIPFKATSEPLLANGVLYVAAGDAVHALDPDSGATRWMSPATSTISLVLLAGTRVLAIGPGRVQAFDAASGAAVWTQAFEDAGHPVGAVVAGDALFVSFSEGVVRRVAIDGGRLLWSRTVDGRPSPPLAVKNLVYVGDTANRFHALDAKDGKTRWSWRTGGDVIGAATNGGANPKVVYYVSLDAVVRAVNAGNGHQRWKHDGGTRAVAPPLALDGSLVVAGLTPALSAFAPLTGTPQGTLDLPGEVYGAPLVSTALAPRTVAVVVTLKDGRTYGLRSLSLMFNESTPPPAFTLPGKPLTRERLP